MEKGFDHILQAKLPKKMANFNIENIDKTSN